MSHETYLVQVAAAATNRGKGNRIPILEVCSLSCGKFMKDFTIRHVDMYQTDFNC